MIASDLINHMIPPLKPSDDAEKAIIWMEELRCLQLPVIEDGKFLGFISEEIIIEDNDLTKSIGEYSLIAQESVVRKESHLYDIIKIASDNNVQLVVVLDEEGNYFGVITVQDTISAFAETATVQSPGSIIVLSLDGRDYSLSEISRLIESENAKILGSSIRQDPLDPSKLKLTLKINTTDLSHIAATLERFNYQIIGRFKEPKSDSSDKERLDILMRYLEI